MVRRGGIGDDRDMVFVVAVVGGDNSGGSDALVE